MVETLANDNTRDFLTSSPTDGIESVKEGYIARNPSDPLYGDGKTNFKHLSFTKMGT